MEKKLNYSSKRNAIYNSLCNTKTHPSARMVYEDLKDEYPNLSLGTVYRNISLFKEQGIISAVGNVNGEERYDAITSPHGHFICKCCGSVYDIDNSELTVENTSLEKDGFECESCSVTFFGTCNKCS